MEGVLLGFFELQIVLNQKVDPNLLASSLVEVSCDNHLAGRGVCEPFCVNLLDYIVFFSRGQVEINNCVLGIVGREGDLLCAAFDKDGVSGGHVCKVCGQKDGSAGTSVVLFITSVVVAEDLCVGESVSKKMVVC